MVISQAELTQERWERITVSKAEISKWQEIAQDFEEWDIKSWIFYGFSWATVRQWVKDCGLAVNNSHFAYYCVQQGIQPASRVELEQLQAQGIPAQDWLDFFYPVIGNCIYLYHDNYESLDNNLEKQRQEITRLDLSRQSLCTPMTLSHFPNLHQLHCRQNALTHLSFMLSAGSCLTHLELSHNQLSQDLSAFQELGNLEHLDIGWNPIFGSLFYLQNLTKLEWLNIASTDLSAGVEYLPVNLESFHYSAQFPRPNAQVQVIAAVLDQSPGKHDTEKYHHWRRENAWLITNAQRITELKKIEQNLSTALFQIPAPTELLANALFNHQNGFQLWLSSEIISLERENREYYECQEINHNINQNL